VDATDLGNFVFANHIGDVWRASNDGAGSGLDADLLDGQQGSYYSNITARLGYTPANKAGDTFTGSVTVANGGGAAALLSSGDVTAYRPDGTGAIFLGNANRYLWFDGSNYVLSGTSLVVNGGLVWTGANDGSGSGMDADTVDGWQAADLVNIPARLGYTPANRAGDTFTGSIQVHHAGNPAIEVHSPGAVIGRLSAQADGNLVLYRNSGAGEAPIWGVASNSGPFGFNVPITRQGTPVWDAGNDGSGSGLDADMVDGWHAHDLAKYGDFGQNLNAAGGHINLPGGLRMQWGSVYVGVGNIAVALPAPFANTCAFAGVAGGSGSTTQDNAPVVIAWNKDNITIRNAQSTGLTVAFFALGW
jgi:hypothetical protein